MEGSGWVGWGVVLGVVLVGFAEPVFGAVLGVAGVLAAVVVPPGRVRSAAAVCVGVGLGCALVGARDPGPVVRGPASVHGVVVGSPVGSSVDVWAHRLSSRPEGVARRGRIRVRLSGKAPPPGTEILAVGRAGPVHAVVLPGAPDPVLGTWSTGVRTVLRAREWHVVGGEPQRRVPPGRHGGVLLALAWGDRALVHPDLVARMRQTGTAHLLAVSGLHVGLVAGATGGVLRALLRLFAGVFPRGIGDRPAWILGAMLGLAYALAAGASAGGLRAGLAALVLSLVHAAGVKPRPKALLGVLAGSLALADPGIVMSPGFQLSFGAVLGLLQCLPHLLAIRPRRLPRWLHPVWLSMSVSVAATVGTLPAAAWWFQQVSWTSPLANLVAGPVVTFVLVPLAAVYALGPQMLDGYVGLATDAVVNALTLVLAVVDLPPVPLAVGPVGALALMAALLLHRRAAWLLALLTVLGPPQRGPAVLRVTFPDVGQGACALVEHPDGRIWLVDGGPRRSSVLGWLRRRGVRRLDVVVASVARIDHSVGLEQVVAELPVGEVWIPDGARGDPALSGLVAQALGRGVPVIPGPPQGLAGPERAHLPSDSDRSVLLHAPISTELPGVVLAGDLGVLGAEEGLASLPRVPALQIPAHGSRASGAVALLETLRPAVAVVQSARDGAHGHPHAEVIEAARRSGTRLWRTDLDGTVELTIQAGTVRVRTWRWDRGWRVEGSVPWTEPPWLSVGSMATADTRP